MMICQNVGGLAEKAMRDADCSLYHLIRVWVVDSHVETAAPATVVDLGLAEQNGCKHMQKELIINFQCSFMLFDIISLY